MFWPRDPSHALLGLECHVSHLWAHLFEHSPANDTVGKVVEPSGDVTSPDEVGC